MQIEKLLKEQEKEFVKKYNSSALLAYPEYAESHMILLTDIWNWHKQSLKQFIDGLVEKLEGMKKVILNKIDSEDNKYWKRNRNHDIGYNLAIDHDISHLKEIRKQLE